MQMIDSHIHLDDPAFDGDRRALLAASAALGITRFVVPSVSRIGWEKLRRLAAEFPAIAPAFGLHPWFCTEHEERDLVDLEQFLIGAVAIGECGLDQGHNRFAIDTQLYWFRAQLRIALAHQLPLIIHCFKATDPLLRELAPYPEVCGVVHGFTGSEEQFERLIERGLHISFGRALLAGNSDKLRNIVRRIPAERLLIETDAPDQSIIRERTEHNHPASLLQVLRTVARLRELDETEAAKLCNTNAIRLFNL